MVLGAIMAEWQRLGGSVALYFSLDSLAADSRAYCKQVLSPEHAISPPARQPASLYLTVLCSQYLRRILWVPFAHGPVCSALAAGGIKCGENVG